MLAEYKAETHRPRGPVQIIRHLQRKRDYIIWDEPGLETLAYKGKALVFCVRKTAATNLFLCVFLINFFTLLPLFISLIRLVRLRSQGEDRSDVQIDVFAYGLMSIDSLRGCGECGGVLLIMTKQLTIVEIRESARKLIMLPLGNHEACHVVPRWLTPLISQMIISFSHILHTNY